jgi:hypothetical protein
VREWCTNNAAIDPVTKSAIMVSEDGQSYQWHFTSNTLSQSIRLTTGVSQAYTPTVIGPDGMVYVINDAVLTQSDSKLRRTWGRRTLLVPQPDTGGDRRHRNSSQFQRLSPGATIA